jgi:hypothetical protein
VVLTSGDEGIPGNSGDADASVHSNGSTNLALATAIAQAGPAGTNPDTMTIGTRGVATASARATTVGGYYATARATASGQQAGAGSRSDTSGGAISSMSLVASATDHESLTTETIASVGEVFAPIKAGFSAMAKTAGLPLSGNVNTQLLGDPNVTAAYNPPDGNHTALALLAMGVNTPNQVPAATPTLSVTADYSFDLSMLTGGKLLVGLLDPSSAGPGFTSLRFTIEREGTLVEDQTFTTLAGAMGYFNDHVLDLGAMNFGVAGTLDLSISLEMTSLDNATRFGTTLLIADVGPSMLPGDYTNDGKVDTADYVMWRKLNGTSTPLLNDPNLLPIDADQYNTWRANFGGTAGPGSGGDTAVPEPMAWSSAVVVALMTFIRRCRRR